MLRKKFSPAEKFAIVEAYLRGCHRHGAVVELARQWGISTALIGHWLDDMRSRAEVTFRQRAPTKIPVDARVTIDHLKARIKFLEDQVAELQECQRRGRIDFDP